MVEAAAAAARPGGSLPTRAIRTVLGWLGLEIYRSRGGVFIVPAPRAGRAGEVREFPRPLRLHLGCGSVHLDGWVNVDLQPAAAVDLVSDVTKLDAVADASVEEIRMEAVYEHLFRHQRLAALREWHRVLVPGGRLHILWIPDFDAVIDQYLKKAPGLVGPVFDLEHVYRFTHGDPVPWNAPEQLHKDVFTRESVAREMADAGFEVERLELAIYRDEPVPLNLNLTARKRA